MLIQLQFLECLKECWNDLELICLESVWVTHYYDQQDRYCYHQNADLATEEEQWVG